MKQEEYNKFFKECEDILFNNSRAAQTKKTKLIKKANQILETEKAFTIEQYFNSVPDPSIASTFNTGFIHYCAFLDEATFNKAIKKGLNPNIFYSDNLPNTFDNYSKDTNTVFYHTPLLFCLYNGFEEAFKYVLKASDLAIYPDYKDQLYLTFLESLVPESSLTEDNNIKSGINLLKNTIGLPEKNIIHYKTITKLIINCYSIETIIDIEKQGFIFEPKKYNDIYIDKNIINEIDNIKKFNEKDIDKIKYLIEKDFVIKSKQSHKQTTLMYLNMIGNKNSNLFGQIYSSIKEILNKDDKNVLMAGFQKNTNEGLNSCQIIKSYEDKKTIEQSISIQKRKNKHIL